MLSVVVRIYFENRYSRITASHDALHSQPLLNQNNRIRHLTVATAPPTTASDLFATVFQAVAWCLCVCVCAEPIFYLNPKIKGHSRSNFRTFHIQWVFRFYEFVQQSTIQWIKYVIFPLVEHYVERTHVADKSWNSKFNDDNDLDWCLVLNRVVICTPQIRELFFRR